MKNISYRPGKISVAQMQSNLTIGGNFSPRNIPHKFIHFVIQAAHIYKTFSPKQMISEQISPQPDLRQDSFDTQRQLRMVDKIRSWYYIIFWWYNNYIPCAH